MTSAPVRSAVLDRKISRGRRRADDRTFSTRDALLDIDTAVHLSYNCIVIHVHMFADACVREGVHM